MCRKEAMDVPQTHDREKASLSLLLAIAFGQVKRQRTSLKKLEPQ